MVQRGLSNFINEVKAMSICPHCGTTNVLAEEDGYVEGPRIYHADCWWEVEETFRFDEISGNLYELRDGAYVFCWTSPYATELGQAHTMYAAAKKNARVTKSHTGIEVREEPCR